MPTIFSYRLEKEFYEQSNLPSLRSYSRLEPYLRVWLDPLAVFKGKRILEIGAGPALYSRMIAEQFAPRGMVALDLVQAQIAVNQEASGRAGVLSIVGDCFHLPFREKSFDVIFGSLILHRFRELEEVLKEIHRVLANDGLYVGIEPSLSNPIHLFRHCFSSHSPNEYLLNSFRVSRAFTRSSFTVDLCRLSPRFPWLHRLGLATCIGVWAKKRQSEV